MTMSWVFGDWSVTSKQYLRDLLGWEACLLESEKWEENNVLPFPEKTLGFPYGLIWQNVIKETM